MGLLDVLFGGDGIPEVPTILPAAAENEIKAGRLPQLNTDTIFLRKGEVCHYIDKALLMVDKTKKIYQHHGRSMPGLFEGNRVNFGTGRTKEYVETEYHKAILYITNKRIILNCKNYGFDKQYRYLSAVKPYTNGLELQYGSKTYQILVPDGAIACYVIKLIQQGGTY